MVDQKFDCAFEGYKGTKRFIVQHPAHGGQELTVAAPDENCALVAAAERWGERWQAISFYAYAIVTPQQKQKAKVKFGG